MSKPMSKEKYDAMPIIKCACGCGTEFKLTDVYGRKRKYVRGHNTPKKYNNPHQYRKEYIKRNKEKRYTKKIEYLRKFKVELLFMFGNECQKCGLKYDGTNASCFDFHHTNPQEKEFNTNMHTLNTMSKEKVINEIKEKCVILCSNCHRLHHTGGW